MLWGPTAVYASLSLDYHSPVLLSLWAALFPISPLGMKHVASKMWSPSWNDWPTCESNFFAKLFFNQISYFNDLLYSLMTSTPDARRTARLHSHRQEGQLRSYIVYLIHWYKWLQSHVPTKIKHIFIWIHGSRATGTFYIVWNSGRFENHLPAVEFWVTASEWALFFFLILQTHSIKIASSYKQMLIILNTDIIHLESEIALWIKHQKEPISVQALLLLSKHSPDWSAGNDKNAGSNLAHYSYSLMLKLSFSLKLVISTTWLCNILV